MIAEVEDFEFTIREKRDLVDNVPPEILPTGCKCNRKVNNQSDKRVDCGRISYTVGYFALAPCWGQAKPLIHGPTRPRPKINVNLAGSSRAAGGRQPGANKFKIEASLHTYIKLQPFIFTLACPASCTMGSPGGENGGKMGNQSSRYLPPAFYQMDSGKIWTTGHGMTPGAEA